MEAAAGRGNSEDRGRQGLAPRVEAERLFDRGDALRERQELGDVAPGQENCFAGNQPGFPEGSEDGESPGTLRGSRRPSAPPIGPTSFSAARQIASGRVGAVTVIRLT